MDGEDIAGEIYWMSHKNVFNKTFNAIREFQEFPEWHMTIRTNRCI